MFLCSCVCHRLERHTLISHFVTCVRIHRVSTHFHTFYLCNLSQRHRLTTHVYIYIRSFLFHRWSQVDFAKGYFRQGAKFARQIHQRRESFRTKITVIVLCSFRYHAAYSCLELYLRTKWSYLAASWRISSSSSPSLDSSAKSWMVALSPTFFLCCETGTKSCQ